MDNRTSNIKGKEKTAIVIIHGIGEQKPMNTLASFVESLYEYENYQLRKAGISVVDENDEKAESMYWRVPDTSSKNYDIRKITWKLRGVIDLSRLKTDCYEFYWAHNFRDTTRIHVVK